VYVFGRTGKQKGEGRATPPKSVEEKENSTFTSGVEKRGKTPKDSLGGGKGTSAVGKGRKEGEKRGNTRPGAADDAQEGAFYLRDEKKKKRGEDRLTGRFRKD